MLHTSILKYTQDGYTVGWNLLEFNVYVTSVHMRTFVGAITAHKFSTRA